MLFFPQKNPLIYSFWIHNRIYFGVIIILITFHPDLCLFNWKITTLLISYHLCSDGSLFAPEARDGRNAPSAAAPLTPWCCPRPGSAAHATPGSPEGDLAGISLSDWTGDGPGHCDPHHGDLPDCESNTGTDLKTNAPTLTRCVKMIETHTEPKMSTTRNGYFTCLWFSFLMVWPKARRCTRIASESSRNTCGSCLCSSESCGCCMNGVWRWRRTCRTARQRSGSASNSYCRCFLLPSRECNSRVAVCLQILLCLLLLKRLCSMLHPLNYNKKHSRPSSWRPLSDSLCVLCLFSLCHMLERSWFLSEWSPATLRSARRSQRFSRYVPV